MNIYNKMTYIYCIPVFYRDKFVNISDSTLITYLLFIMNKMPTVTIYGMIGNKYLNIV